MTTYNPPPCQIKHKCNIILKAYLTVKSHHHHLHRHIDRTQQKREYLHTAAAGTVVGIVDDDAGAAAVADQLGYDMD